MSSRRHLPPPYDGRSVQAPGMMTHGPFPGMGPSSGPHPSESLPVLVPVGNKIAVQAAEMGRLAGDNEKLAATHVSLRQQLVAAHHELQRLQAHIRSIQTESDIQMRLILEKNAKMQVDTRAGETLKKELQQAHNEVKDLVKVRQELTDQIQNTGKELQKSRTDVKNIAEMHAELDALRQEHYILRITFEHEKGRNIEQVEHMQTMEKNMLGMARELDKLRAELLHAEARPHASIPYSGQYLNHDQSYPPPTQSGAPYMNTNPSYQLPAQTRVPHIGADGRPLQMGGVASLPPGGGPAWGGAYDPSLVAHSWR